MLSIGVEKLYKLSLGLIALDADQRWPSASAREPQRWHANTDVPMWFRCEAIGVK